MNFEQIFDMTTYEGYYKKLISLGMDEQNLVRFTMIIGDEHGNELYNDWIEENHTSIDEKFRKRYESIDNIDVYNTKLFIYIINGYLQWIDGQSLK